MKKHKKLILNSLLALLGGALFYRQNTGINYFIFSIFCACTAVFISDKKRTISKIPVVLPCVLGSVMLSLYPQTLTLIVWLVSFLIMWSKINLNFQPILLPVNSLLSVVQRPLHYIKVLKRRIKNGNSSVKYFPIYLISLIIITVFIYLYAKGNPVFGEFLTHLDLSFVEFGFIATVIFLFVVLFGLVFINKNRTLSRINKRPNILTFGQIGDLEHREYKIASLSIWSITILLSFVNILDLKVIFTGKLPQSISYSEYVHQGFYTLIFTLSLAVSIIIYFFRNQLNFYPHIRKLRTVSYFWISQNITLAILTAYKNMLYVEVYGLTYKRIAVFLCLICTLIGLVLCMKKIRAPHTNWSYFNKTIHYAFISAVIISFLPFDSLITYYNLNHCKTKDIAYLLELEQVNYKQIIQYWKTTGDLSNEDLTKVHKGILVLSEKANNTKWPSWNYYTLQYRTLSQSPTE